MSQVDYQHYAFEKYIDLKRWISYYYQLEKCLSIKAGDILIIGKGDGLLEKAIINYNNDVRITTFDYAEDLNPDVCGNVLELSSFFKEKRFSIIICCQVLEHLPFELFERALHEIQNVLKKDGLLVLSLPDNGICLDVSIHIPKVGYYRFAPKICKFYRGKFKYNGEHYWEINSARQYSLKKVKSEICRYFELQYDYLVPLNHYHHFFVCKQYNQ